MSLDIFLVPVPTDANPADVRLRNPLLPVTIEGSGAIAFGWASAAVAQTDLIGTAASSFGWSTTLLGAEVYAGPLAEAFGWRPTAAGRVYAATATATFGWSEAAEGTAILEGTAAPEFGWSVNGDGQVIQSVGEIEFGWQVSSDGQVLQSVAAIEFGWETSALGGEVFAGPMTPEFGWSVDATGAIVNPDRSGTMAATFGWTPAATGLFAEAIVAESFDPYGNVFGIEIAASGTIDLIIFGSSAIAFGWEVGQHEIDEGYTTVNSNRFGWSTTATGAVDMSAFAVTGTAAPEWSFELVMHGHIPLFGPATAGFGWSVNGSGTHGAGPRHPDPRLEDLMAGREGSRRWPQ